MKIKALLISGLLGFGPGNEAFAQMGTENYAGFEKEVVTAEGIENLPEAFWASGFILNGCKIEFPCILIDLMRAGDYKSSSRATRIPPTGENERWAVTLTNGRGEQIDVTVFNPTGQEQDETDCLVKSICIGPRSDNRYIVPHFAVFGLIGKESTREEVVETVGKYCGAPAYVIECPDWDLYQFYDKKPTAANSAHWSNIKIAITISKMEGACNEKMIGFDFQHVGDFYRKRE